MKFKLGVLSSHPIQYYAPLFRSLSANSEIELTVFYCHKPDPVQQGAGFGVPFQWDVDLESGYPSVWLQNKARRPGLRRFLGCDTPEIGRIIRERKFDSFLVLGWNHKSMWQAMKACWDSGTPLMVRGDSHLYMGTSPVKSILKNVFYPHFIRKFAVCLAVGKWSAEYFEHYGARRIIFSPHFVDNDWFASQTDALRPGKDRLRKDFGIPAKSRVVLFAGKFEEKKRPMDLLKAAQILSKETGGNEPFFLLMAGDGVLRETCRAYAKANSISAVFPGFLNQTQLPSAYAASDVLALPSDGRETWGLVVNEAMASGLPCVVSNRAGCSPDLIREGETGLSYPCGSVQALAAKIREVCGPARPKMGDNARKWVSDHYSIHKAAEGILATRDIR